MTKVIDARSPSENRTNERGPASTETPKLDIGVIQSDVLTGKELDRKGCPGGIPRFVTGYEEHSTAPTWDRRSMVSSSQDHADAIFEAPGANIPDDLRHLISNIGPTTHGKSVDLGTLLDRFVRCNTLTATPRGPSTTPLYTRSCYDIFRSKLIATLFDDAIEDGVAHPAEDVIAEALRINSSECLDWLSRILVEYHRSRPSISASIVRCVGRLEYDRTGHWGMRVADDALRHDDVEVREAAIRALESWGGSEALRMLRGHTDSVAWLNEYVNQVVVDLSGNTW